MGQKRQGRKKKKTRNVQETSRPNYNEFAKDSADDNVGTIPAFSNPSPPSSNGDDETDEASYYDAIDNVDKMTKSESDPRTKPRKQELGKEETVMSGASVAEAMIPIDNRPEISTFIDDEELGMKILIQGRKVCDVVTGKAVRMSSLGPEYRLAQMFPGVPPEVREKHRLDWSKVEYKEVVDRFRDACSTLVRNKKTGLERVDIPPHPSVSDDAVDFVLANHDKLGSNFQFMLGRLKLRAQSLGNRDEAIAYRRLNKHYMTLLSSVASPFRQALLDAETRVGPNFGNLDLASYCGKEVYERTADYLTLKAMVAHWEQKLTDAEIIESKPLTSENLFELLQIGDPARFLPDSNVIFRYDEVVRITIMAQNMTRTFVQNKQLFDDLPPEVRFLEKATFIREGGTSVRKYMIDEFCPAEGIRPEALREGLRRLEVQMSTKEIDPYSDIQLYLAKLLPVLDVGSDDIHNAYADVTSIGNPDGPGRFQTYTFNHDKRSLVRFLDFAEDIKQGSIGPVDNIVEQLSTEAGDLFGFFNNKEKDEAAAAKRLAQFGEEVVEYEPPADRAAGRPHNLGWLEALAGPDGDEVSTGCEPKPEDADEVVSK